MRILISVSVVLTLMVVSSANLPGAEEVPGLAVGKKAPAFKLKDQKDKEQTLEELLKKKNVALVFYRSADW